MTDFDTFEAGIEYKAEGELIENIEEANQLPKHTDGGNIALRNDGVTLSWTEDLGANIINLDGYLHADWDYGYREYELDGDRIFIPEEIEMHFVLPSDELIEGAKKRAAEDASNVAYILGGWTCQARGADHVDGASVRKLRRAFDKVMESEEYDTPNDARIDVHHGGKND